MRPKLIIFALIFICFLGFGIYFITRINFSFLSNIPFIGRFLATNDTYDSTRPITISYHSLFEPKLVYDPLFVEYRNKNTNISINFEQRTYDTLESYKDSVLAKLKTGEKTPDILRIHVSWISDFKDYLYPAPKDLIDYNLFSKSYYVPVVDTITDPNTKDVYGIPLMYDSLALFYNKDLFTVNNINPPQSWSDFTEVAKMLTVSDGQNIQIAGAAIGSAENVAHFSNIISLLASQSNLEFPEDLDSPQMKEIIDFYTRFVLDSKVWDRNFAYSPLSFAKGNVAMMFGPSWELLNILQNNPQLNVGVVAVPQIVSAQDELSSKSLPNFWIEVVNKNSQNPKEAWKLIQFLGEKDQLVKAFQNTQRVFGEPYPLVDLQQTIVSDPYIPAFYENADNGKVFKTLDKSGNAAYTDILKTVVEGVLNGDDVDTLLKTAKQTYESLEKTSL